jgi:hypothetical protein
MRAALAALLPLLAACGAGTVTVSLPTPAPPGAVLEQCARLVNYLPATLDGQKSRVVKPRSPLVHAWGSPPIVMRCGVTRPKRYDPGSPQTVTVNGVTWFQEIESTEVHWTAIRTSVNIELVVPRSYGGQGGFLVELGASIKKTIP